MIHVDGASGQQITYLYLLFNDDGYPRRFIKRAMRQRPLPTTPKAQKRGPLNNETTPALRPGSIGTESQTLKSLQPHHRP